MRKALLFITLLCLGCLLSACATQQTTSPKMRVRTWSFEQQAAASERVQFVPKGVYITGLKPDGTYPLHSWVRLVPGTNWPAQEPRPTLLTGRIAERDKTQARIEILALEPGIREPSPRIESYPVSANPASTLHAITKRLLFPAQSTNGDKVAVTFSTPNFMSGNEIYGAFDLTPSDTRLASQNRALLQVNTANHGEMPELERIAGALPDNPVFVLLDAPVAPAFDVELRIPSTSQKAEISAHIRRLLDMNLPGMGFIRLSESPASATPEQAILDLGNPQTTSLVAEIVEDNGRFTLIDQGFRVTPSASAVVINNTDPELAATALVIRALELLGYPASMAWILEDMLQKTTSLSTKAAVSPALAQAYHRIERDDWAMEIGLELLANAEDANKKEKILLQTAAASIFSICHRAEEFVSLYETIYSRVSSLASPWQKLFAHAVLSSPELPKSSEYFKSAKKSWNEYDEMRACLILGDEDDTCSDNQSKAQSEIGRLWFQTFQAIQNEQVSELISLAEKTDAIGAPFLSLQLWTTLFQLTRTPNTEAIVQAITAYARDTQNVRKYLRLMLSLVNQSSVQTQTELSMQLIALDWRAEFAEVCMKKAVSSSPDESIAYLELAAELFVSIGDAENTAIATAKLSHQYEAIGQSEKAVEVMNRAKSFAGQSHIKEVLQAISGETASDNMP